MLRAALSRLAARFVGAVAQWLERANNRDSTVAERRCVFESWRGRWFLLSCFQMLFPARVSARLNVIGPLGLTEPRSLLRGYRGWQCRTGLATGRSPLPRLILPHPPN